MIKVTVSVFHNGWCPGQNLVFERTKRAVKEIGGKVILNSYNTSDRRLFLDWGISDALFIDDKQIRTGPPPAYEKIRRLIAKKAAKIK